MNTTAVTDQRRLLEQAVRQLREAKARLAEAGRGHHEPLAVIGAAVRAPGGVTDLDSLWDVLSSGTDTVKPWPGTTDGRRDAVPDTGRWAGLLDQVDQFDAGFFGIAGDEADHMDPQQRLVLEAAWEAVEDAGVPVERLRERPTGVFLGLYGADYLTMQLSGQAGITAYTAPGGAHSIAANRLSFLLDLHGPSLVVDTACSSSLVALHLATRALRAGECDLALVGGVNVVLCEPMMAATEKVLPMASSGRCRTFDASADGIVRSEGCGVLLLERLSDAKAAGRRIRALVRGSAVNHNGRTNGLTAPSPRAQAELLRQALADGAVDPHEVVYVEAHGTGTRLGDPIEIEAIREVYGAGDLPCAVGSVKTNFGHQEAAAGIVGLLKAMLVVNDGRVPPSLHLDRLSPEIDLAGSRLVIPTTLRELPSGGRRLAAVSSFGFGGTNAHVVLEAAPAPRAAAPPPTGSRPRRLLLPLSARDTAALGELADRYAKRLEGADHTAAADLCAAAALGRSHHPYRICVGADTPAALAAELRAARTEFVRPLPSGGRIAFVFSGQGTQWTGMGCQLLATEPVVLAEAEECDAIVRELAGWSVLDELRLTAGRGRFHETEVAQVCIAVLQLGLAALWRSWGVEPAAVTGHSMGEVVAACVAGNLDRRQALGLLITRARIAESAAGGAMADVALPAAEVAAIVASVGGRLAAAAVNGPRSTVVAGDPDRVARAEAAAAARGAKTRRLPVGYAFHSPLLDGGATELAAALATLRPRLGGLPQYSTVTGDRVGAAELGPEHWGRNLREPVLFSSAVAALARDGSTVFVEIGPHPVLVRDIHATLEHTAARPTVVGSLRRDKPAREVLDGALADLYHAGVDIRWDAVVGRPTRHIPLPGYPWQRRRYWLASRQDRQDRPAGAAPTAAPPASEQRLGPYLPTPDADVERTLVAYVRAHVARALGLGDPSLVAADATLDSLGLNSLTVVELKNGIERDLGLKVPLQSLLDGDSPAALARAVTRGVRAQAEQAAADTGASADLDGAA
ncbi:type I polyketide synthase [Streptomyces sp. NBC_01190]|uniref:type I polyketide synthase n=1 Tax=Streptomyces sp. NBC_01190 TaxID=2903767 RepID=UPI00386466BC|nr:acyltransferase domain-containing protein [Streptomyces sp. NBC_01190]